MSTWAFGCKTCETARQFFETYFTLTAGERYHNPRKGFTSYFLSSAPGEPRLELMHRTDVQADASPAYPRLGIDHLALSLGSTGAVDEQTELLRAAGYAVVDGPRTTGDGYYESVVLGPEGLRLELTV